MAPDRPNALTRLYRSCDPEASLKPRDPRYVNCDAVRGSNVVLHHERSFRNAEPGSHQMKLFAGHRGVGKTSELFRLKERLEKTEGASKGFLVLYFDVRKLLDVNDLDFPDLLVALAGEVQEQLVALKLSKLAVQTTGLKRAWNDLKGLLGSEVRLNEIGVELPFSSLALEIRNRPTSRTKLREAIESHSTSLLEAFNDQLTTVQAEVRDGGRAGLVLLVDGLDALVRRPLFDGSTNTHDRLFLDRADQLGSLLAHVVYTVPISLIYSPRFTHLEQTCGTHTVPVGMIRVRGTNQEAVSASTPGMQKLLEILRQRCAHAEVAFDEAFEAGAAEYLCEMSGGHPRHLLMFVRSAISHLDSNPVTQTAAESAVRNYANALIREVIDEAWEKLGEFAQPSTQMPKDDLHQEMLHNLWVYEYMNGAPWYEVNPVLRTIPRFQQLHQA